MAGMVIKTRPSSRYLAHLCLQMLPFERMRPANNPHARKIREKYWINQYEAIEFGENKQKSS